MQLQGERVLLREFAATDTAGLAAIHADPRVLRYYAAEVATFEHAQMLVEKFVAWAQEVPRRNFQLAIVDLTTCHLVGSCGVRCAGCAPGKGEFGIGIGSHWFGKGIAHEAARLILDFAFGKLGLEEVYGVAVAQNEAVAKFARRLGLAARAAPHTDAWMTERGWTAVEWAITRGEW